MLNIGKTVEKHTMPDLKNIKQFRSHDRVIFDMIDIKVDLIDNLVTVTVRDTEKTYINSMSLELAITIGLIDFNNLAKIIK